MKRTQASGESQKKLVTACRGMNVPFQHGIRDMVIIDNARKM
jgi:hypothetical protein